MILACHECSNGLYVLLLNRLLRYQVSCHLHRIKFLIIQVLLIHSNFLIVHLIQVLIILYSS